MKHKNFNYQLFCKIINTISDGIIDDDHYYYTLGNNVVTERTGESANFLQLLNNGYKEIDKVIINKKDNKFYKDLILKWHNKEIIEYADIVADYFGNKRDSIIWGVLKLIYSKIDGFVDNSILPITLYKLYTTYNTKSWEDLWLNDELIDFYDIKEYLEKNNVI